MRQDGKRGLALLMVILTAAALAILSRAVTITAARRGFDSVQYVRSARATLLAEAATQFVIDEVSRDPDFDSDISDQTLTSMPGSFSVDFEPAGSSSVDETQSVNNLEGTETVDGPRGEDTVPPGTLNLVVLVNTGDGTRIFETIIRAPNSNLVMPAVQGAGRIKLQGNVSVDGISSPSSDTSVEGGLHSGWDGPGGRGVVEWSPQRPGDSAVVTGRVTATTNHPNAIDMVGALIDGGTQNGVPSPPVEDPEILDTIAGKSGANSLTVPPFGMANVGSGEFYSGGDVAINGDLVLDDSKVFISGNLSVNGSIRGKGSVWVSGETHFRGDSVIRSTDNSVSLMSHGNVHLEGFGGMAYLESHVNNSGDPLLRKQFDDTRTALQEIDAAITANPSGASLNRDEPLDAATQSWRRVLADPQGAVSPAYPTPAGMESDTLSGLIASLQAEPSSPSRDFMLSRLESLRRGVLESNEVPGDSATNANRVLSQWQDGDMSGAAYWDLLTEYESSTGSPLPPGTLNEILNYGKEISFDKIGSSSFRGVVHTDGAFLGENEVNVVGQIQATGTNDDAPNLMSGTGERLEAGDVMLTNGSHITYCQDFLDAANGSTGSGKWQVEVWIER